MLLSRCNNESDETLALLNIKMYQDPKVIIGNHAFSADSGVVQGGFYAQSSSICTLMRGWYLPGAETLGEIYIEKAVVLGGGNC